MGSTPTLLRTASDVYVYRKTPTKNTGTTSTIMHVRNAGNINDKESLIYWGLPFPRGVQILSAKIRVMQANAYTAGSVDLRVTRLGESWNSYKVTWNNRPASTGPAVTVSKTNPGALTTWEFDVTALMQTVSNGAPWYGFKFSSSNAATQNISLYTAQASEMLYRPVLEITWKDNPSKPTKLSPTGGRAVGVSQPVVQCDFTDISGDTSLAAVQVRMWDNQTNADGNVTPTWDSGEVASSVPELDTAAAGMPAIASGANRWWRMRVKDGAGLWSLWSDTQSFFYGVKGSLFLNSPSVIERVRNLVRNPRGISASGWTRSSGTGGVSAITPISTGGPLDECPSFVRETWTTAPTSTNYYIYVGAFSPGTYAIPGVPGQVYSTSIYARSSWANNTARIDVLFRDSAGTILSSIAGNNTPTPQNTWTLVKNENNVAPAGTAYVNFLVKGNNTSAMPTTSDTFDAGAPMIVAAASLPTYTNYFDGSEPDYGSFDFSWAGTANQSESILSEFFVAESTPPISWNFTGRTQSAYEVIITAVEDNPLAGSPLLPAMPSTIRKFLWSSGKTVSTDTLITLPAGVLTSNGRKYGLTLMIWDTLNREATPGDSVPVIKTIDFVYSYDSTINPNSTITSDQTPGYPWVVLNWTRTSMPDQWDVYRNDELVASGDGDDFNVTGNQYRFTDRLANPRKFITYTVIPVVNGKGAKDNPTTVIRVEPKTISLSTVDGARSIMLVNYEKDMRFTENSQIFTPAGGGNPILLVQADGGYTGRISGRIENSELTIESVSTQIGNFEYLRRFKGATLLLTVVDRAFKCFIYNATYTPVLDMNFQPAYDVEFDFAEIR